MPSSSDGGPRGRHLSFTALIFTWRRRETGADSALRQRAACGHRGRPAGHFYGIEKATSSLAPLVATSRISCPKIGCPSLPHRIAGKALLSFNHPSPATYRTAITAPVFLSVPTVFADYF